jgi:hypothetical protein
VFEKLQKILTLLILKKIFVLFFSALTLEVPFTTWGLFSVWIFCSTKEIDAEKSRVVDGCKN